jgi:hypothetical protein
VLTAIGGDNGVVIVAATGRGWIPVGVPAQPLPTTIVAAAPRARGHPPRGSVSPSRRRRALTVVTLVRPATCRGPPVTHETVTQCVTAQSEAEVEAHVCVCRA